MRSIAPLASRKCTSAKRARSSFALPLAAGDGHTGARSATIHPKSSDPSAIGSPWKLDGRAGIRSAFAT